MGGEMIANILDGIKRLFGEGKIRVKIRTSDGRTGTTKVKYIGVIDNMYEQELKEHIIKRAYVEEGITVTSVEILGYY
jgi:hypothetical protein